SPPSDVGAHAFFRRAAALRKLWVTATTNSNSRGVILSMVLSPFSPQRMYSTACEPFLDSSPWGRLSKYSAVRGMLEWRIESIWVSSMGQLSADGSRRWFLAGPKRNASHVSHGRRALRQAVLAASRFSAVRVVFNVAIAVLSSSVRASKSLTIGIITL